MEKLKNENIIVEYDEKEITIYQLNDINETTAYTKTKRNVRKCWNECLKTFNCETEFTNITDLFRKYNIRFHKYCGLD